MSTAMRYFWLVTLVFFVGGCSSYKLATYPGMEDEAGMTVELESMVEVGDKVKITMTDNSQVEGKIMEISPESITLEPERRSISEKKMYGESQPKVIRVDRIQTLEKAVLSEDKTGLLVLSIIIGIVAVGAIGVGLSMK